MRVEYGGMLPGDPWEPQASMTGAPPMRIFRALWPFLIATLLTLVLLSWKSELVTLLLYRRRATRRSSVAIRGGAQLLRKSRLLQRPGQGRDPQLEQR